MNSQETSARILSLASEAGHILLENGAEISRVEDTMERIATHFGEQNENFFVLSNGIFTTGKAYANVKFIPIKGARLDKVVAVNQFSRDVSAGKYTLDEAEKKVEEIRRMPEKPLWEQFAGAALGSGAFCAIFGGSLLDCAAALVAGTFVYLFLVLVCVPSLSKALSNIFAGALGTALCILFNHFGFGQNLGNMMVGTLIPLIPGVAFTNGLRDIAGEDYLAGITRLLDAMMVFLCIAVGVCLAFIAQSAIEGGMIHLTGTITDPVTAMLPIQLAASFIGTASFAVLFGVPRKFYLQCGVVGMAGWLTYLVFTRYLGLGPAGGTFFAATLVALLSLAAAHRFKCPSTVFLICGIFPLIPGAGVFWSSYFVVSTQMDSALAAGFTAVKITLAIVLGIVLSANLLTRKLRSAH
ncbi:MAG: threonine/serine exporter family protein [Bacteroidales bacterium]|nr:threonine/serine exporter family protein [Bacteroidales bacterium]MBQ3976610.1 threonine/serine exporter family protein [Bacteroidales bacterium]MBQ4188361.1 threonine/serine exporter family protein [Bacteroidales bacterium]MBR4002207.1 threonine/serine exporter family protein [Bacteroidales bacterium]